MSENKNYISSVKLPGDDNLYHIKDREAITANDYAGSEKAGVVKASDTIVVDENGAAHIQNAVRYDYDQGLSPEERLQACENISALTLDKNNKLNIENSTLRALDVQSQTFTLRTADDYGVNLEPSNYTEDGYSRISFCGSENDDLTVLANVAPGKAETDAVNYGQFSGLQDTVENIDADLSDACVAFDGTQYGSLGNAIRAQGVKIDLEPIGGVNQTKTLTWQPKNATITEQTEDSITVQNNGVLNYWLDPISVSEITPHVGYYANGDFTTLLAEDEEEAGYLNDGCYNIASDVWGSASLNKSDVQSGKTVPALVFNFNTVKFIGGIELSCKIGERYISSFEIQLHGSNGWHTVYTQASNPFTTNGTVQFTFNAEMCSALRVLVYDYDGTKPQVMEMLALEAKTSTPYNKVAIQGISTNGSALANTNVNNLIDNDKYTNFQTSALPCNFTLDTELNGGPQKVSRMKLIPYSTKDYAPKDVKIEVLTASGWITAYEGTAFTANQKEACVLDFNDTYEATSVRLVVNSILSQYIVFNGIELYGLGEEIQQAQQSFGIVGYNDILCHAGDIWFVGANIMGEKHIFEDGESYTLPSIEFTINKTYDPIQQTLTDITPVDLYTTFIFKESLIDEFRIAAKYEEVLYAIDKKLTISNIVLVNLTETYGAGNEPTAQEYYDLMKATWGYSHQLTISSANGKDILYVKENEVGVGMPGKSAYQYARNGGYAGTEEDFANSLAINASSIGSEISEWMILGEGELSEPVSAITINRNLSGEEFSVSKVRVELLAKPAEENCDIYIQLSDEDAYQVINGLMTGTDVDTWMEFDYNQNHLLPTWYGQSYGLSSRISRYLRGVYAPITSVVIGSKGTVNFSAGTKYRVYYK